MRRGVAAAAALALSTIVGVEGQTPLGAGNFVVLRMDAVTTNPANASVILYLEEWNFDYPTAPSLMQASDSTMLRFGVRGEFHSPRGMAVTQPLGPAMWSLR